MAATRAEIVAFSDANTLWSTDALRLLVRSFADPDVAYVCGFPHVRGRRRHEPRRRLRALRGRLRRPSRGSARSPPVSADLRGAPQRLRRARPALRARPRTPVPSRPPRPSRGRRPDARAWEKPAPRHRGRVPEEARDVRALLADRSPRGHAPRCRPLYALQLVSHRHLRYVTEFLHLFLLLASARLALRRGPYRLTLGAQLALLGIAASRPGLVRYYVLVTWATLPALAGYLRRGCRGVGAGAGSR